MSTGTKIQWTEATWNPLSGCTPVSPGCLHCYAATMSHRLEAMGQPKYKGLTVLRNGVRTFNGTIRLDEKALTIPLHWKKPRHIFVNSMSDLFHKDVPFEFVDKVFAVMEQCPQHTFQVLTKRPERMAEYLNQSAFGDWPLPNVWLGTSVENQKCADERIPWLLQCPAAVRFLSCEPLLGPIDLGDCLDDETYGDEGGDGPCSAIDWVIVGGESGPNARRCDVNWIADIIRQCRDAGLPCFVKQLGSRPFKGDVGSPDGWPVKDGPVNWETGEIHLKDSHGADMAEWPEELRVREWPKGGGQ